MLLWQHVEVMEDVTSHQPNLTTLFQTADELMTEANDGTVDSMESFKL